VKHRKHQSSRKAREEKQLLTLKIYTEGEKTEVDYIKYWYRLFRHRIKVIVSDKKKSHGAPSMLVDKAIKEKKYSNRQLATSTEYWCVFDVDAHPNIGQVIQKAEANDIKVAVSNPCIELWFTLHFREQERFITGSTRLSGDVGF